MSALELVDVAPETDPLSCVECGTELVYAGTGRKPKYCDEHRPTARKAAASGATPARGKPGPQANALATQAATALANVNALVGTVLMVAPGRYNMPLTAEAIAAANDGFAEQAAKALATNPKLAKMIVKAGESAGSVSLIAAYGMLLAAVAPVAVIEYKGNAGADRPEE